MGERRLSIAPRTLWQAAGIATTVAVTWVVVARAIDIFVLLFIAIVFAEGLRPLVNWLVAHRLPRHLSVLLLYAIILSALGILGWLILRPVVSQALALINSLPVYLEELRTLAGQVQVLMGQNPQVQQVLQSLFGQAAALTQRLALTLLAVPQLVIAFVFKTVAVYLMTFFWLTATDGLLPFVLRYLPEGARAPAVDAAAELSHRLGGTLRGAVTNMLIIGVLSGLGLAVLSAPYPVLLGLTAGLAEIIPILGPWIGGVPAVLVALANDGLLRAGEVLLLYFVLHLIEGNTLVPYVMHRATQLSPLTVVFAVLLGGALLGPLGAVLAVPIAVVVQVVVTRLLDLLLLGESAAGRE